jgi:DNA-binding MarR family transcriptional regulator
MVYAIMIAGNNAITIRENNIALIIRLINKAKICSRADLAIQTGLKQATITYIINDLI